ncbi:(d)CMP kinase [Lentisalinibacter sediminis]|uniref:(d)CMP kinase n=1 Tax=Lentisalinibacter sediminis TaxID=2992237 RepID=UPI00386EBCEC
MNTVPVIAIDGPSGSGKGTIARRVATALGFHLLDSGALYRLTALASARRGIDVDDVAGLVRAAREMRVSFGASDGAETVWLDGDEVGGELRTEECGRLASRIAAVAEVREALKARQRDFREPPGLVADGRDMGTAIFPAAALKIFLTASAEERARRRYKQLKDKGIGVTLAGLARDIAERDRRDTERSVAPLVPAEDAIVIDSTSLGIEQVTEKVLGLAAERLGDEQAG